MELGEGLPRDGKDPEGYVRRTHSELAALIGSTQTGVTKALGVLRRQGLVEGRLHRRGIRAPDVQKLASYTGENR
jgi:CRP-like cAMP-binding protein